VTSRLRKQTGRVAVLAAAVVGAATVLAVPGVSHAQGPVYYLSLGDSYSVGYQPLPSPGATSGYTGVVAAAKNFQLENFGCGGATTASILSFAEQYCGVTDAVNNPNNYGPAALAGTQGPVSGNQSQLQAAEAFIAAHPGQIGLITVSIGGNDVTPCAGASVAQPYNGATDPITCVVNGLGPIQANVTTLADGLRSALTTADGAKLGKKVPIVGLTYPDVLLGLYVNSGPGGSPADTPMFPTSTANQTLAGESVQAFQGIPLLGGKGLNPALKAAYKTAHGKFVDVTKKTGGYTKLTKLTKMNISALGLGTITVPKAVAEVCTLTWYCQLANIHANTAGYNLIGGLVAKAAK
jgi:hypothetical protein